MIVIVKQTNKKLAVNMWLFVIVLLACVICPLDGRVCTRVTAQKGVKTVTYPGECLQSYQDNCGWFTSEQCTFNETVACLKTKNFTVTQYRIVEDCCPGYYKNGDGKCVRGSSKDGGGGGQRKQVGVDKIDSGSHDDDDDGRGDLQSSGSRGGSGSGSDDDDDGFFLGLSHGAYAGIVCGILFVACVALLTAIHYRKRRLQEMKKAGGGGGVPADQEAAQRQQMISLERMDSSAPVAT